MDILEQVDKVLKDIESRERKNQNERRITASLLLSELTVQYNECIGNGRWEPAHKCLLKISRLVVAMLSE
jgi:hypothetical protein